MIEMLDSFELLLTIILGIMLGCMLPLCLVLLLRKGCGGRTVVKVATRWFNYSKFWRSVFNVIFGWEYCKYDIDYSTYVRRLRGNKTEEYILYGPYHIKVLIRYLNCDNFRFLNRKPSQPLKKYKVVQYRLGDVVKLKTWWPRSILDWGYLYNRPNSTVLTVVHSAFGQHLMLDNTICVFHSSHLELVHRVSDLKMAQIAIARTIVI